MSNHWEKLSSTTSVTKNDVSVNVFRSRHSKLTVAFADFPGPVVKVNICMKINPEDNLGAGHALEHLVFKGSTCFIEQNMIDRLCSSCYSSSTNAATYPDHTRFEFSSIAKKPVPSLIAVFLCHIFHPSFTDKDFKSEIYFRDEDCRETGVMFCELKDAFDKHSLISQEVFKRLYPDNSPFSKVAGGSFKSVRKLNLDMVETFHIKNYRPENTCLIITGQVSLNETLLELREIDLELFHEAQSVATEPISFDNIPLHQTTNVSHVRIDGVNTPLVAIGWIFDEGDMEVENFVASSILTEILSDALNSGRRTMSNNFTVVESNNVGIVYVFDFSSCNEDFDQCEIIVKEKMLDLAQFQLVVSLDEIHNRIADLQLNHLKSSERDPHAIFAQVIIQNFLSHREGFKKLEESISTQEVFSKLLSKESVYWRKILEKWIGAPWVIVKFDPSKKLSENSQVSKPSKYTDLKNTNPAKPLDALKYLKFLTDQFKLNLDEISFLDTYILPQRSELVFEKIGLKVKFLQTNSDVFNMNILSDSRGLTERERLFLPLLSRLFSDISTISCESYTSPIQISTHASLGLFKSDPPIASNYFCIWRQCIDYIELVSNLDNWLEDLFVRRLSHPMDSIRCQAKQVQKLKIQPHAVINDLLCRQLFKRSSNRFISSIESQEIFLKNLESNNEESKISEELLEIGSKLFAVDNLDIFVSGDFRFLNSESIMKPWKIFLRKLKSLPYFRKRFKLKTSLRNFLVDSTFVEVGQSDHRIYGLSSCKISSLLRTSYVDVTKEDSKVISSIMLIAKLLSTNEGNLWKKVRGKGLAYHCGVHYRVHDSLLCLSIQESVDVAEAFAEISECILFTISDHDFLRRNLESARGEQIHELVDREDSIANSTSQVLISLIQNLGDKFNRDLVARTLELTLDDLIPVFAHFKNLFKNNTVTSIVCPLDKSDDIKKEFKAQGINLQDVNSRDNKNLGKITGRRPFI